MTTIDCFSKYFFNGNKLAAENLANQLNLDLIDRIESIYKSTQNDQAFSSGVLLEVANNALCRSVEQLHFFKNRGQCRGACEWFIALFLNFKKNHPEIPTHKVLIEITKEFAEGVGIQGAFLQKSYEEDNEHQNVIHSLNFDLEEHSTWDMRNKEVSSEILKKVNELEDGVYLLSFSGYAAEKQEDDIPGHATVIIIESGNYYFFDPNIGLAGTGRDVGTENKISDVACFLMICQQYSSFDRADQLFKNELKSLSKIIGEKEVKIIEDAVYQFRQKGKASLGAYEVKAILDGFKSRNRIFSSLEEDELFYALCIRPGLMQVKLELSESLRLKKCIFLG